MFRLAQPIFLILALLSIGIVVYHLILRRQRPASIRYSDLSLTNHLKESSRSRETKILPLFRGLAVFFLVLALARPQSGLKSQEITSEGIDIMLVLDISGSMRAEDFSAQNRLYAAKQVIEEFISERQTDRIGLVIFSRQSFLQCPLTLDYKILKELVEKVDFGMIEDGTAIGLAIANAVDHLQLGKGKSKITILLTDGINNSGEIDPITATRVAQAMNIKIYTVGAGKPGRALYPVEDPIFGKRYVYLPNELDEKMLQEIANITGGEYFRAKDEKGLSQIYKEISQMEKTKIKIKEYVEYNELFSNFALFGLILVLGEIFLSNTRYRRIP
ncbi:MAG TPA: VWA domain-containing protein [candidate division Zixibacteria bacterium]